MQTTQLNSGTNVSKTCISSKPEPINFSVSFIDYLLEHNFKITKCSNEEQVFILIRDYITIKFQNAVVFFLENTLHEEELPKERLFCYVPNTLDQWTVLLACLEYIKLPINYQSDEEKLNRIEAHLDMNISVHETLLTGADNADNFNMINAALSQLKRAKTEITNIRRK